MSSELNSKIQEKEHTPILMEGLYLGYEQGVQYLFDEHVMNFGQNYVSYMENE